MPLIWVRCFAKSRRTIDVEQLFRVHRRFFQSGKSGFFSIFSFPLPQIGVLLLFRCILLINISNYHDLR